MINSFYSYKPLRLINIIELLVRKIILKNNDVIMLHELRIVYKLKKIIIKLVILDSILTTSELTFSTTYITHRRILKNNLY